MHIAFLVLLPCIIYSFEVKRSNISLIKKKNLTSLMAEPDIPNIYVQVRALGENRFLYITMRALFNK